MARNPQEESLIGLCGLVGLRVSEARRVEPTHLDRNMILKVVGKGDKTRFVPVSERAWSFLCGGFMDAYPNKKVVPFSDRVARGIVTNLGKRAGLPVVIASHDLRATYATIIQMRTKDIIVLKELLGHASVVTTQIYTLAAIEAMREAVEF